MVTEEEIRTVVRAVIEEERTSSSANIDASVLKTISAILTSFGIDEEDRKEIRADFIHLRKWRKSTEKIETMGWTAAITVVVGGLLGALWLGLKTAVGK